MLKWFKITMAISVLLLIAVGFAIGYLYTDKGCMENPLIYGIEKMNEANEDNDFACSCYSRKNSADTFSFDRNIMIREQFPFR